MNEKTLEEIERDNVERIMNEEMCVHGMSAWLCAHPIYHYPTDEMMNEGRYY